ncbi:DUF4350 domain-containing protein [Streptomyces sp. NPDC002490]|uniref:DUF4350 domain-containing protein n=1 Tax=Streptomyces sp. NPDC002490 TaxID=3154416 RepID=UPI0033271B23
MTETTTAGTSTAPTPRHLWHRARGPLVALLLLLLTAIVIAALRSGTVHGRLDPRSADPLGSLAISELLADRGVDTRVVTTLDAATAAAADPDTTLLVAAPDLLGPDQQDALRTAIAHPDARTVLVAPDFSTDALAPGVTPDDATSPDRTLPPGCTLPAAERAGDADTGGLRYHVAVPDALTCYPSDRLPTLVHLPAPTDPAAPEPRDTPTPTTGTTVLGSPHVLVNERLDAHGNASLALQLLGSRPHLAWYLPSLSDETATVQEERGLTDHVPAGWGWATLQLGIAAVVLALWRARRLGPLVPEHLPVAVRASETTEGRARLYHKARARDRAADALRATTRSRLAPLLGVPPARAHSPEHLLPPLTARTAATTRLPDPHTLLFGPPPRDDTALLALADHLDALEREVRVS